MLGELVGGIAGAIGAHKQHKAMKDARKRGLRLFGINEDYWAREPLFDTRDRFKRESVANIEKGYGQAKKNLRGAGMQAIQGAKAAGKQTQSAMQQSMADRGLYNTTVLDNATRGISSDTSRAIQDIQLQVGQLNSKLELDKMEAMDTALGRNLGLDEQSAWDWFKFMVGGAGYGSGATNSFNFGASENPSSSSAQHWGSIGSAIEDSLAGIAGMAGMGGGSLFGGPKYTGTGKGDFLPSYGGSAGGGYFGAGGGTFLPTYDVNV